jgi:hypothetical protein
MLVGKRFVVVNEAGWESAVIHGQETATLSATIYMDALERDQVTVKHATRTLNGKVTTQIVKNVFAYLTMKENTVSTTSDHAIVNVIIRETL